MKQRHWRGRSRASVGGECHASPRGKGHPRGGDLELRCPEGGGEAGSPTIFLLPGNQVSLFRVVPNFPERSSELLWRSSFFPSCGRDWAAVEPRASQKKRFHREKGARGDEWGWGPQRTMRAPWSAVRNSSNPTCWNARRRRLLHSGPNVFVITPDRLPARYAFAPALGRATPAHRGTGARSPSHFTDPANRWGLPQTLAHVRAPSACPAAAAVVLCLAPARTRRSAPSSTTRPRPAPCAPRLAPKVRPSPAEPFTPPLLASPSAPHSALFSLHLPQSSSRAPHHRLQRCPAKPRARNENTH